MKPPRQLLLVAQKLGPLRERVVFVGGMIRPLLTTDPAAGPARPTDDVDLIIDVSSRSEYAEVAEQLRASGFNEDTSEGAPLCRWIVEGVKTDVMPIDPAVFGFSNAWYDSANLHPSTTATTDGVLRHLDAPHFCATKLEAFASRAGGDYYHHDIEDFLGIVDERLELVDELAAASPEVRDFVAVTTRALLATPAFVEALAGHLAADEVGQQRLPALRAQLERIAALASAAVAETELPPSIGRAQPSQPVRRDTTTRAAERSRSVVGASPSSPSASAGSNRIQLRSSNLDWVEYDAETQTLLVGFKKNTRYEYSNVPAGVYQGLLGAYSKGRYFRSWIRDRYRYKQLR